MGTGDGPEGPMNFEGFVAECRQGEEHLIPQVVVQVGFSKGEGRIIVAPAGLAEKTLLQPSSQLHRQPFRRPSADPGSLTEAAQVCLNDGLHQGVTLQASQQTQRHLGTDAADGDQLPKQIAFMASSEPVEGPAVIAHGLVNVQHQLAAGRWQALPLAEAHLHLVAHAMADQQQAAALVLLPGIGDFALQPADHGGSQTGSMLPAPSPPVTDPWPALAAGLASRVCRPGLLRRVAGLVLVLVLLLPLAACSSLSQPPRSVVLQALGLQIELTQGAIAKALALESMGLPEVSRVRIERQEPTSIGDASGWHLMGAFDWRLPGDAIRVDSPFDLYLQRGSRGESWRLARPSATPDGTTQEWITDPLSLPSGR